MTARTTSFLFTNIVAASLLTFTAIPSVVLAQNAQAVVAACVSDLRGWCAGFQGEKRRACIKVRFTEFSLPCQLAAVKYAAIKKACAPDVKKTCAGVLPGGGNIEVCLKDHFADLSEGCKVTILRATGKS